ncbi:MAG: phage tail protein, partial [Candidatus Eisenbacteria bacterium]|nr:phage tail protein [Candidatus Eisenbacteria bacterium]
MADPFIGEIRMFGGNFAPRNWAKCDGQLIQVTQNDALFSLIGTIYGGDGRTTFGLPEMRGRIPIHQGQGPGLSNRNIGQRAGVEQAMISSNEVAPHSHVMRGNPGDGNSFTPADNVPAKSKAGLAAYVDNPN